MAKLFNAGYSVVETNHLAAVRNGKIKAQYPCTGTAEVENGMLLVVEDAIKNVRKPVDAKEVCHLHASEERIYESHLGRRGWVLNCETQIPKMLTLHKGDIFETNAVDGGTMATVAAAKAGAVYGVPDASGYIKLLTAAEGAAANVLETYGTVLKVSEFVLLPNETEGIKFTVEHVGMSMLLSTGTVLSSFGFLDADNEELADDVVGLFDGEGNIHVEVPFGTDVTALVADFTASAEATVEVGTTEQVSGTTENDFTEPVVYTITAENGMTNTYTVIVTIAEED